MTQLRPVLEIAIPLAAVLVIFFGRNKVPRWTRRPPQFVLRSSAIAFWLAAAGGIGTCVGEIVRSRRLTETSAFVFATGVIWFFSNAVERGRRENVPMGRAIASSTKDALRFALYLMP